MSELAIEFQEAEAALEQLSISELQSLKPSWKYDSIIDRLIQLKQEENGRTD